MAGTLNMELWLAFVAASAVVLMIPGPTVFTVIGFSITQGRRYALVLSLTVAFAHATMLSLAMMGLAAILTSHPELLSLLQICGAAYLVYTMFGIGSNLWKRHRNTGDRRMNELPAVSICDAVRHTYLITLLNPGSLFFFVALLPQFVTPTQTATDQLVLMSLTFVVLSAINSAVYGFSAATAASRAAQLNARSRVSAITFSR